MSDESQFPTSVAASLDRAMRDLTTEVKGLRGEIADVYARKDVIEPRLDNLEADIKKHGDYWDWLVKLVCGAVILALLSVVIVQSGGVKL
ncbi:MAG: hypothetical protein FWE71_09890 [Nocardioidaceae bacterium]|nr:hypothetical protein [Nocardioidaceae bacterium]MCL2611938.1 hypothetical protein [Nocardioidaceae bacterium]